MKKNNISYGNCLASGSESFKTFEGYKVSPDAAGKVYYRIECTGRHTYEQIQQAIYDGFNVWCKHTATLKEFLDVTNTDKEPLAQIVVSFGPQQHHNCDTGAVCPFDFDGQRGILAHCLVPTNQIHFDDSENWDLGNGNGEFNLRIVAAHEVGHRIGAQHSELLGQLMSPYYNAAISAPQQDDIAFAQSIYGKPAPVIPPLPPVIKPTVPKNPLKYRLCKIFPSLCKKTHATMETPAFKTPLKSRTIWAAIVTMILSLIKIIYPQMGDAVPEIIRTLGEILQNSQDWQTLILGIIFFVLRLLTTKPILPEPELPELPKP